jgi:hypothetical protein
MRDNHHIRTLEAARERMVKERRLFAFAITQFHDRNKGYDPLSEFLRVQSAIEQIDKAIADETKLEPPASPNVPAGDATPG